MSGRNLRTMYNLADADDLREGKLAYWRYHGVIKEFADVYASTA